MNVEGIEEATVIFYPTDTNTSILESEQNISCGVSLKLNDFFNVENSENIAIVIAASLGNDGTDDIKIMDQQGTLLFGANSVDEEEEFTTAKLKYVADVTEFYTEIMRQAGIKNQFDDAEVSLRLDINMDEENVVYKEYLAGEGLEQDYMTYHKLSSTNTSVAGDVPGTDSNDETDYYIASGTSGDSSSDELDITYTPSERLTNTTKEWGVIDPATSTVSITLNRVKIVYESDLELLGTLDTMTFDEYIAQNRGVRMLDATEYAYLYDIMYGASSILS